MEEQNQQQFVVYSLRTKSFLRDDEKSWTSAIEEAAVFFDGELAKDIGVRESEPETIIYVFAICYSIVGV